MSLYNFPTTILGLQFSHVKPFLTISSNTKVMVLDIGLTVVAMTIVCFSLSSYAVLFSAWLPSTGIPILDALSQDTHYKYFALLMIPTTSYFVIANWVGWQYYRNS